MGGHRPGCDKGSGVSLITVSGGNFGHIDRTGRVSGQCGSACETPGVSVISNCKDKDRT